MESKRVAPLAGAWIETCSDWMQSWHRKVAPLAGAWIETEQISGKGTVSMVAPLAGAWIETDNTGNSVIANSSLPSRERGLKHSTSVKA